MCRFTLNTAPGSGKFLGLCAILVTGGLGLSAAQASVYDFENLPNGVIQGRDGWLDVRGSGLMVTRPDVTPENGTQVAQPDVGVLSGWFAVLSRVNDDSFQFSPFSGAETNAVLQFDVTAEARTAFGLGTDVDGDGVLTAAAAELGPIFGTWRDQQHGTEQFAVMASNFNYGTIVPYVAPLNNEERCCNADSDWYRLQLRIDFTANGGAGSGSLYYMNLTRGDGQFQPVTELQNLDLGLDAMDPAAGPETWNAMWMGMRFEGSQSLPRLDNLVPRVLPVVMQANEDLPVQGVDGMDSFGLKYDVTLRAVEDPSDPAGYFWQLGDYAVVDPDTPSSSLLRPDLDLVLGVVDLSAVTDVGTATMFNVCLEFQGWDGIDHTTMTWKYVRYVDGGCQ